MNSLNETAPETAASRERVSQLSAAILRISASLDQATVLQEAVASARALTGARYGLIATVDEAGEVGDLVSSGLTPEEHRGLVDWPHGPELFAHLRDLPGPFCRRHRAGRGHARDYPMAFESAEDVAEHLPRFIDIYDARRLHSARG